MMPVSVVVTTRNRRDDLRTCLRSVRAQDVPLELIVIDDASTDGTADMVRAEFPEARLIVHEELHGLIRGRNEAARIATGDVIVSLDDDAVLSTPAIVGRTLASFDEPRIAAVAIPYIDVNRDSVVKQLAPDRESTYVVGSFIGTAHAVRRDQFLRLGGYREPLFHQGEESDFCVRLLAAGYLVRLGSSDPIHHFESVRRDFRRMDHYGPRNAILFVWQNAPLAAAITQMPATIAGVIFLTFNPSRLLTRLRGVVAGLLACARFERQPVPPRTYRLWRRLRKASPPLRLADVSSELPPLR